MKKQEKRFWAKVNKTDTCWLWTAAKANKGYGAFGPEPGKVVKAHRYSWEMANGPITDGMCVLHKCDVPACVNPDHLFLGTKADNNRDMHEKGRNVPGGTYSTANVKRGSSHHGAKLNEESVRAIRKAHEGGMTMTNIAKMHGVAASAVHKIIHRRHWKHVE